MTNSNRRARTAEQERIGRRSACARATRPDEGIVGRFPRPERSRAVDDPLIRDIAATERVLRIRTGDATLDERLKRVLESESAAEGDLDLWESMTTLLRGAFDRVESRLAVRVEEIGPDSFRSSEGAVLLFLIGQFGLWSGRSRWCAKAGAALLDHVVAECVTRDADRLLASWGLHMIATAAEPVAGGAFVQPMRERADHLGLELEQGPAELLDTPSWRAYWGARAGASVDLATLPDEALVPVVVLGILGADAEAPFGRLTLAPTLPESWSSLSVRELPLAESGVALHYQSDDTAHTFRLEQPRGRTPINLVFAPAFREEVGSEVRLGSNPIRVDRLIRGDALGIRLQTPLDAPRTITVGRKRTGDRPNG